MKAVVALTLHAVLPPERLLGEAADPFYCLSADQFQQLCEYLQREGITAITSAEILEGLAGRQHLPGRAVVLTFDDGHASDCEVVLPLLGRFGLRACFFITTGFVGRPGYLSWAQVAELAAAGMEIGSHGVSHRPLTRLASEELQGELQVSKERLEQVVGRPVFSLAVPGGFWSPAVVTAAARTGYRAVWLSEIGRLGAQSDPLRLGRVVVRQPFDLERVRPFIEGHAWAFGRARLQQRLIQSAKAVLGLAGYERLKQRLYR
jgi:peptidoglycan/xylan/chitin deacetylase (PgdA/CDA1 family)